MHIKHRAVSGVFWGTLSSLSGACLQLIQLALLGRLLGAQDFGLVAMTAVAVGFANVFADVGLSNAIVTRHDLSRRQLTSFYWLNTGTGFLISALIMLCSPAIAWGFGVVDLQPLVVWSALSLLVAPIGLQFQLLLQKELQIRPIALVEIVSGFSGLAVSILAALHGHGAYALVFGNLAMASVKSLSFFMIGIKKWPLALHFSMADIKPFVSFGAFQVGERALNFAAWNMDKVMIGSLLGAHALGLYTVAYQLMQKPIQFVQPILTRVMTPLFATINQDQAALREGYAFIMQSLSFSMFPILIAMSVLAEPVIRLLVGSGWVDAAPVLRWLTLLGCLYAVGFPIGSLLLAKGRADMAFGLNVWALLLYVTAVSCGSRWGIEGVAIALLITQLAGLFSIGFWVRWKLIEMQPAAFLAAIMPSLISAAVAGLLAWLVSDLLDVEGSRELKIARDLLIPAFVMAGFYMICAYYFQRPLLARLAGILRQYSADRKN